MSPTLSHTVGIIDRSDLKFMFTVVKLKVLDIHYKLTTNGNKLGFLFVVGADYFVSVYS